MMRELLRLRDENKLNKAQMHWFEAPIPTYELYDVIKDSEQLHNLSNDLKYQDIVKDMSEKLEQWLIKIDDKGDVPEGELLAKMWPDLQQPVTDTPIVNLISKGYQITCTTKGADIVYRIDTTSTALKERDFWHVYQPPIPIVKNKYLHSRAVRIGYADSKEVIVKM